MSEIILTNSKLKEFLDKSKEVVFQNTKVYIKEDLYIEGKSLSFINCEVFFEDEGGIVVKDGTFIAENSVFRPKEGSKNYKNIILN